MNVKMMTTMMNYLERMKKNCDSTPTTTTLVSLMTGLMMIRCRSEKKTDEIDESFEMRKSQRMLKKKNGLMSYSKKRKIGYTFLMILQAACSEMC